MVVDSYLELFTTLFGWVWYNSVWFMLKDTGLLLLPFVGIVLDKYLEYRKGFEDGDAEELTLKGLEVDLFLALFVVVIAGSPAIELEATELSYTPPAMIPAMPEEEATPDDSKVTYGKMSFEGYPDAVEIPVWWHLVFSVANGIGRGIMEDIPDAAAIRYYTEQLRLSYITDPALKQEANDFFRDCFVPARSKYMREKPESPAIDEIIEEYGTEDPHWMGSHVYQLIGGYYDTIRSATSRAPFLYSALRDNEWEPDDPLKPTYGKPYCNEWWTTGEVGLKAKLVDSMGNLDLLAALIEAGWNVEKRHDALILNLFKNSPPHFTPRGYDYGYNQDPVEVPTVFSGAISVQDIRDLAGLIAAGVETGLNEVGVTVLINGSAQFQAIMIMFIVAFLPFVLFLSKYDFSIMFVAGWAIFTLKFLTVIWFCVWWIDQNLWAAMYPEVGMITAVSRLGDTDKRLLLNYIIKTLYYAGPLLFIILSTWGGYQVLGGLNSIKQGMMGGMKNSGARGVGIMTKIASKGLSKGMK